MTVLLVLIGVIAIGAAFTLMLTAPDNRDESDAAEGPSGPAPSTQRPARNIQDVIRDLEADEQVELGPSALARYGQAISPQSRIDLLEKRVVHAAEGSNYSLAQLYEVKFFGLLVGFVGGAYLIYLNPRPMNWLIAGVVMVVGFIAVDVVIDSRAQKRQKEIQDAVPDMLDQMVISVESGLGLESALTRIAGTNDNALADELTRTLRDMRLGASRGEALYDLLDRVDVADLRLFIRALILADRSGVPIANVCRVQASEAREKRRVRAEEQAMKLPVKLIFPLVLCILPALFIVVLGPAVIQMQQNGLI